MQQPFVQLLRDAAHGGAQPSQPALRDALKRLDLLLSDLAGDLQVEHFGPHAGLAGAPAAHQLVVREHVWNLHARGWGAAVCSTQPGAGWRADWPLYGVSRERQMVVVRALPAFLQGYQASISAAGLGERNAGRRVAELAAYFAA
ncbi:MAG: hypothetical protein ACOY5C_05855 [Pseudomonadota bacterium]|uniref:hypothetical protein n=1 Tax=Thermithiobacillus tepidarius TaxID=929 RepID=UPI0003F5F89C|nr:hypothetical protein [Thermithiobacillus tepidarius]